MGLSEPGTCHLWFSAPSVLPITQREQARLMSVSHRTCTSDMCVCKWGGGQIIIAKLSERLSIAGSTLTNNGESNIVGLDVSEAETN